MNIRSQYSERVRVTVGGGDSMVRQSFKDECDINKIIARYSTTGQLPLTDAQAVYGDVSDFRDYKSAVDTVMLIEEKLRHLPKKAREAFEKDPSGWMNGIGGAEDRDALEGLGLVEPVEL